MPHRAPWQPDFHVGHAQIDAQHQGLLAQCNRLADLCASPMDEATAPTFDQAFERLKALAREHFETEAAVLTAAGDPDVEDHRIECDEFEYLADEIATTAHFDRLELQRFVTLWCMGHIAGSAPALRDLVADATPVA